MQQLTTKELFSRTDIKTRFEKLLGDKAEGFISSTLAVVANNKLLEKAEPSSVLNAAASAAVLDLPINQSLGFAWIVPYKGKAQFQIGWKGFVQLAQRSGRYKAINVITVYANQFNYYNSLTEELQGDFSVHGKGEVVGFAAYFELLNGFKKTVYWPVEKVVAHARKFSQSYRKEASGVWKDDFEAMAMKTVLKNTLSKYGPLTIQMQQAQVYDQAVLTDAPDVDPVYVDNPEPQELGAINEAEEIERAKHFIVNAKTEEQLEEIVNSLSEELLNTLNNEIQNRRFELAQLG